MAILNKSMIKMDWGNLKSGIFIPVTPYPEEYIVSFLRESDVSLKKMHS